MSDPSRRNAGMLQELSRSKHNHKRLHVIFVTTSYPTVGNPQPNIFTHRAIKALSSEIEVEVIEFCSWKRGRRPFVSTREYDGVHIISFACPRIPLRQASHINTLIQSHFGKHVLRSCLKKADLIHAASLYPPGFVAGQWAKSAGKACTAHAIGSDVNFLLPQVQKALLFQPLWYLDGIACECDDLRRKVAPFFPASQNIRTVYRGVNTEEFSPPNTQNKNNSNSPHSPLRFLFLGGFHSWDAKDPSYNIKGGPIMLQAWQQIERQIAPDELIVGGPHNDLYRAQLEQWRASLERPEAVRFLPPALDTIVDVLRESDVVVIPSLSEGLPNLAREAQSCGRPVLGTDAGGIPEAVLDRETGIIVPRGDVDALSAGFLWFHTHKDKVAILGRNARNHMLRRFSWNGFSIDMIDFFRTAIEIHRSKP